MKTSWNYKNVLDKVKNTYKKMENEFLYAWLLKLNAEIMYY